MNKSNIHLSPSSLQHNPHLFRSEMGVSIRQIREIRGLTQEQLAEKMSISRSTISKIESGKYNFSIDYLSRFALFLEFGITTTISTKNFL